jgi:hypothetical protein
MRLTGLAGLFGALLMFSGDMLLYGGFYGGSEFSEISIQIMGEIPLLRLMIGGAIGPVAAVIYAMGFWQVFLAIKTAGKGLAAITFSGFASMIVLGGTYHAGFVYTGLILRATKAVNEIDLDVMNTLMGQASHYLNFLYNICFVFGAIGTIPFLFVILFRRTHYPKWMVLFTPTLLTFVYPIAQFLPSPVGGIVYGGFFNLTFLIFFCVSTMVLWHGGRKVQQQ